MGRLWLNLGSGCQWSRKFVNVDAYIDVRQMRKKQGIYRKVHPEKGARFVAANLLNLPFRAQSVDYIECISTIEHIELWNVQKVLEEMRRVLKVGARVKLLTENFNSLVDQWKFEVMGKPMTEQLMVRYLDLAQQIYGHQVGGYGQCHKTPFTVEFMANMMWISGFRQFNVTVHPRDSELPKLEGFPWPKGSVCRTEFLVVDAMREAT